MGTNKATVVSGEEDSEITLVLKKKKFPWWIFLFLLLFVFIIPIGRTVRIHLSEKQTGISIAAAETKFSYPAIGLFGSHTPTTLTGSTDNEGKVQFEGAERRKQLQLRSLRSRQVHRYC